MGRRYSSTKIKSTTIWERQIIKANEILNNIAFIKIIVYRGLAFDVYVNFLQLMNSTSSSQRIIDEQLTQFQREVRLCKRKRLLRS